MSIRQTKKVLKKANLFEVYFKGVNVVTQFDCKTFHKNGMLVSFSCIPTRLFIPYKKMRAITIYSIN